MLEAGEQRSEVARLLSQISAEYEAAQRGLTGLSYGTSQHEFITKRMENIQHLHVQLQTLVGDTAIVLVATQLDAAPNREQEKKGSIQTRTIEARKDS